MKKWIIWLIVLIILLVVVAGVVYRAKYIKPPIRILCTADAKICDDGTYVSRNSSLNCEFNSCPGKNIR